MKVTKPTAGWKANAYIIFDYFSPTDFKFAGLDQSTNKIVMGHRTASGWNIDVQAAVGNIEPTGTTPCRSVSRDLRRRSRSTAREADLSIRRPLHRRIARGLNTGLVGVGSDNSRGVFDNFVVQTVPPQTTYEHDRGLHRRHRRRVPAPHRHVERDGGA